LGRKIADVLFVVAVVVVLAATIGVRLSHDQQDALDVNFVLNIVTLVALLYLGRGYILNAAHRQEDESRDRTLAIQETEMKALSDSNDRLAADLSSVREKCAGDVAHLSGKVEQLQNENASLRQLVMLDKVPPAMIEAMQHVAGDVATSLTTVMEDRLGPIEQQLGRLVEKQLLHAPTEKERG